MNKTKVERFTGVLAGWDGLIRDHYCLGHAITTITAARDAYQSERDLLPYFRALFDRIDQNLNPNPSPSVGTSNWELRQAPVISEKNKSLEKLLEKRVVNLDETSPFRWSNQVPACSGFATSGGNRKNSIDLVHECTSSGEYSLIELKVSSRSGTPFYATYEILSYGLLYLLTRTNERLRSIFEPLLDKTILKATKIRLIILAPTDYYTEDKKSGALLERFEHRIHEALGSFAEAKVPGLEMGFEFRQFSNPVSSRQEIDSFKGFDPAPYGQRVPFLT